MINQRDRYRRKQFGEELTFGLIMACLGGVAAFGGFMYLLLKLM